MDLNIGYYHIELAPKSKKMCTIVLSWGKYEYQKLPMGLCNSPDIFQENTSNLFSGFEKNETLSYVARLINTKVWSYTFDTHIKD